MTKFQAIVLGIFIVCIVAGVIAFSTFKGTNGGTELPSITIWGTFPQNDFDQFVSKVNMDAGSKLQITYREIPQSEFDNTFIGALARGQGPDAILIPQDMVFRHEDKIVQIPYSTLPIRDYKNTFIQQAELYLGKDGAYALPFLIDPMVMYWNRDIFTNNNIALPPGLWEDFNILNAKLTQKDNNSNIRQSAVALGEFSNIIHAREILGTILMQNNNFITYIDSYGTLSSSLGSRTSNGINTSVPAFTFFTQFSNPNNKNYSWNRSMKNSKNAFLSGSLATYFGFASELADIREKNPNLDFDVATMPQFRNSKYRLTYGSMYGFSIVRSSANVSGTYSMLNSLLAPKSLGIMVNNMYLPPVRRDMMVNKTSDPYLSIFYNSALISRGWLDNNKSDTNNILKDITESITSGKYDVYSALQYGSDQLDVSLKKQN